MFVVSTIFSIFSYFNFTIIICNLQEKNGKKFAVKENFCFVLCCKILHYIFQAKKNGARYEQGAKGAAFPKGVYFA